MGGAATVLKKELARDVRREIKFPKTRYLLLVLLAVIFMGAVTLSVASGKEFSGALMTLSCNAVWEDCAGQDVVHQAVTFMMGLTAMGLVSFIVVTTIDALIEGKIGGGRMRKAISKMKGHFVICGYGRVGKTVADMMRETGTSFVVIEQNPAIVSDLKTKGIPHVEGDGKDPAVLERAGVKRARGLVTVFGEDADNVFVTLTAKELNPNILVASRTRNSAVVSKLHRAGAEIVVMPEIVGGREIAREMLDLDKSYRGTMIFRRKG